METKKVVIVGGGFAGLNCAKGLLNHPGIEITLIDKRNYHLFQPLLYQVAMASLGSAEIAQPIRALFGGGKNIRVLNDEVVAVDREKREVVTLYSRYGYDFLVLACGVQHSYFGHEEWEEFAPGLKTLEQATEIRRRVLSAFEMAERETDKQKQKQFLTFVVVGGGPTGVELAGAIGEMSRFTLANDFWHIDPSLARVILIEAGARILPSFHPKLAQQVARDLEGLGVQTWTSSTVTHIDKDGVTVGEERILCSTVLWAAGVQATRLNQALEVERDRLGRILVEEDMSLKGDKNIFVIGDQAHFQHHTATPLPGLAPVATQMGRKLAKNIKAELSGKPREPFSYVDKGQMATIGRSKAIVEIGSIRFGGFWAWVTWLLIHIYYLLGFKNRFFVIIQWAWAYLSKGRPSRLITGAYWRFYGQKK
ncbi:MAG: pyridine nucleotide-disulfide oxidoreductase [Candidatus Lambdaproteobacteria bacterium RIFOXYD1_FULL_56_27]|uniref:NADH:ubiquinone reductase (non-electrogenic) n=1 Tax=Candidatus Lambdaproteobacteria bacterium RIFOXYD2_FULL_56_26 TaxID=1817773 RepID=A0A1F6GZ97_9PROT|nr:MAG: pyridine nucleotide-disulfide oxidoreductase [Candidatus Lambdaproteobacteria bacterium RIFOXYC1_FULL_56_13]OGH03409.1 MAG: pyridine nucleotide-disulfide oxidoreductase [Candidatus Lambdaproteobacteria bacterium RIFOXYD2_FULL_56_26]OGH06586.1 MAG: pyridine nucleotide-disulfide oxidoreductase [Candidatus Lambdaproteobacteria bacterium RIFOXYD1_FULL_56_27]